MSAVKSWDGAPVLVTGGAGFIGSHLADALVARGARVRVLDSLATGRRENLAASEGQIEFVEGDIRDFETCRAACEGVACVFHEAALGSVPRSMADPSTTIAVNVAGTANVFGAARSAGAGRVVYASSSSVYGDAAGVPKREGEEGRPLSPYALSKRMNEELAELFARAFGVETVGLRYFNVYGPRQDPDGPYAAVVPRFVRAALRREPMTIHGDGEQSRDFTYVADAVEANLAAAAAPPGSSGRAFNVGAGAEVAIRDLAAAIARAAGSDAKIVHDDPRAGDVRRPQADGSLAARDLGFSPRVGWVEGIRRTVEAWPR